MRFSALAIRVGEHMPTVGVRRLRNGGRVSVQELRRCLSHACHSIPFKSRDKDAAQRILEIVMALLSDEERPDCYTRDGYKTRVERALGVNVSDRLVN